jgi:hypothetical protein
MLKEIAESRGIELIEVQPGDELCQANGEDSYIDHSYICGNDRIELGIYSDPEKRIVSFFHEIGHTMSSYKWRLKHTQQEIERRAWKDGYKFARSFGIVFNKETKDWAEQQVLTYKY